MDGPPTLHASAVLVGARAVLIRGPSAAGKSRLAFDLLQAAKTGLLRFARLVGDDRVHVDAVGGRLRVRPAAALRGLIEMRGVGVLEMPYEESALVGLVVDLAAADAERLPQPEQLKEEIQGVLLPRLAVAPAAEALPAVLALLT